MIHLKYIILSLLLGITSLMQAQTVALPDVNMIAKLEADYPGVMDNGELDIAAANAHPGTLNLKGANISDATGVEYFTNINTLDITDNNLTTLPDLSGITNLINLYVGLNELNSIQDLSGITTLKDFQAHDNNLTALPGLPTGIEKIYCGKNALTTLPDLSVYSNLKHLVIGNNPLEEQIDFGSLTNLTQLHVHQLGIQDSIIGLSKLTQLEVIFAWGNQISDFSALDSNTILNTCVISDNQLTALPYLANKPDMNYLDFTYNYLSFEDIIPVNEALSPAIFAVSPQRPLVLPEITTRELEDITLTSPIETYAGNIYVWKKDGELIDSSANNTLSISNISYEDSGTYTLTVYNEQLPELVLYSDPFTIDVKPCVEYNVQVEVESKACREGYTINVDASVIEGGVAPYAYELIAEDFYLESDKTVFDEVPAGDIQIIITDAQGCTAQDSFILDKISGCDPVFSPNGDGVADTYFIEDSGKVQVFDTSRQLVTELQGPIVWNGTTSEGALVDAGYYILVVNDEKVIYLTLIR